MPDYVQISRHDEVALLLVDNPPVNALSPGVPEAIEAALAAVNGDAAVRAVVLAGAGRTFMAGADIRQFQETGLQGTDPANYLEHLCHCALVVEDSPKPVVMAIHGTAFGAGLEIALAGHYRVMAAAAQLGQPEIKLGLIPGAGGTQRLPRLAGVEKALEMCALGEPVTARDAQASGIVDLVIEGDLLAGATGFAREVMRRAVTKTRERAVRIASDLAPLVANAKRAARHTLPGQTAPLAAIRAVAASTQLPFSQGMARERELFLQCWQSDQAKALVYLFFAQRAAGKAPEVTDAVKALAGLEQAHVLHTSAPGAAVDPNGVICLEHPGTKLVEVIRGALAEPNRVKTALEWARKHGKTAVVTGGFVSQRMAECFKQDVQSLLAQGLSQQQIDSALVAGSEDAIAQDIVRSLMSGLAEEGGRMLKEGLVLRASDIDVIWTLGYGFPAWRGGPMFMSNIMGNIMGNNAPR